MHAAWPWNQSSTGRNEIESNQIDFEAVGVPVHLITNLKVPSVGICSGMFTKKSLYVHAVSSEAAATEIFPVDPAVYPVPSNWIVKSPATTVADALYQTPK